MPDASRHNRLTRLLEQISTRLEDLQVEVRRTEAQPLPPELIDEIASTAGELILILADHRSAHQTGKPEQAAASHANLLREGVRRRQLHREQIAEAVHTLTQEVSLIINKDKRAA